ncbi:MAG TPA: hypothetical protein VLB68_12150 [Pyrinomonadaceae bacterium]|nr:hypothetical protein [Pyrinomonadaceae bacterium]
MTARRMKKTALSNKVESVRLHFPQAEMAKDYISMTEYQGALDQWC